MGLPHLLRTLDAAAEANGLSVHLRGSAGVGSLLAALRLATSLAADTTGPATRTAADHGGRTRQPEFDHVPVDDLVARLRKSAPEWGGSVVVLDGPEEIMRQVDCWGPVAGIDLMRQVKERFDPERLLSPGRFVGGI